VSRRLVLDDGRVQRDLVVRDVMTVGRDPGCDVCDSDPRLSRRHAEFRMLPEGVSVRDLNSRNGVKVNGRLVRQVTLAPGDLVEIAHLAVRFVDDESHEPAGQARPTVVPVPAARVQVRGEFEDDRTRVVRNTPLSSVVSGPIRAVDRQAAMAAVAAADQLPLPQRASVAARPAAAPLRDHASRRLGVQELMSSSWGWRVLAQGALLAAIVFMITVIPMLAWFTATTGPIASGTLLRMLGAPLAAALVAGLMVAALIARTTARALRGHDGP
jgi:hypothetical protein